VCRRW
jgi:hypothetical protein